MKFRELGTIALVAFGAYWVLKDIVQDTFFPEKSPCYYEVTENVWTWGDCDAAIQKAQEEI